jgi:shikimate dehydrogenase
MTIGAGPYRYALLGDPVEHSLSPVMHRAAFKAAGIDGSYSLEQCSEPRFLALISELRKGQWQGFNVTMPHKQLARSVCDRVTPLADTAMSVNTLQSRGGEIVGDSTDARAFEKLFSELAFEHKPVLVLGAGGSASAALAAARGEVFISSRNREAARALAARFASTGTRPLPFGEPVEGAVIVNATPIGMHGEHLPETVLAAAGGLIDLPYGSEGTPAVQWARTNSVPVCDGVRFLALQAAGAFAWWTGVDIDPSVMEAAARNV